MKALSFVLTVFVLTQFCLSGTIIVDINGGGNYTTIGAGIQNANTNDTVKVWPGTYTEQVSMTKNIILMGSGYENTIIRAAGPTVTMNTGTLQWFQVSSSSGNGITMSGGIVKNCVIIACATSGITSSTGSGTVENCICINNGNYGIYVTSTGTINATNCIGKGNGPSSDFVHTAYTSGALNLSYSNGRTANTSGNAGMKNCDPGFSNIPLDLHIAQDPNCSWNTGNPSLNDPDGSISDMGYFGGPDCPIYPVVFSITATPDTSGTFKIQAKARADY